MDNIKETTFTFTIPADGIKVEEKEIEPEKKELTEKDYKALENLYKKITSPGIEEDLQRAKDEVAEHCLWFLRGLRFALEDETDKDSIDELVVEIEDFLL